MLTYFIILLVSLLWLLVLVAARSSAYNRGRAAGFADGRRFPRTLPPHAYAEIWPSPEEFH